MTDPPSKAVPTRRPTSRFRKAVSTAIAGFAILYTIAIASGWIKVLGISTGSMNPTFEAGDRVMATRFKPAASELSRGQLVIYSAKDLIFSDLTLKGLWVNRVAALPGDEIRIEENHLLVNGERIERNGSAAIAPVGAPGTVVPTFPFTVPPGHVFLLGDNFSNSLDSRYFGPIEMHRIGYRPVFRVFPPGRAGKIE